LAALGCKSTSPTGRVAPGHEGAPAVQGFLLCPVNLVIALPAELEGGVEPVQQAIVAYLQAQGRGVDRLTLPEAQTVWAAAIEDAKASGAKLDFAATARAFTRRLADGRRFDAVVMPSLLLITTRIQHRRAEWDGVERHLRIVNLPHRTAGRSDNWLLQGLQNVGMSSNALATTLHVVVLSREGRQVFEGRGGLELVHEADFKDYLKNHHIDVHARSDLLQDPKVLREGVEVAFTPYLQPPGR